MKKKTKKTVKDDQFPGYPKYPANEDIMNRAERVLIDENAAAGADALDLQNGVRPQNVEETSTTIQPDPLDLEKDHKSDDLKDRVYPVDFAGKDLDVPGTELDDESEEIGNEDEENNLYSNAD